MEMKRLIIFDLDGTLLNTIADLANSTNHALSENGFPTHDISAYKKFVGNGIMKLFERALPADKVSDSNLLKMRASFLEHYDIHNCDYTKPYEGITELLHQLSRNGIDLAVASNKYDAATKKLIGHFFPDIRFMAVEGNKDGVAPKPNPTIVHEIMAIKGYDKRDVMFVGDSGVDMQTALNAEVESCGVTWGFRPVSELMQFSPDHIVNNPEEIASIVLK